MTATMTSRRAVASLLSRRTIAKQHHVLQQHASPSSASVPVRHAGSTPTRSPGPLSDEGIDTLPKPGKGHADTATPRPVQQPIDPTRQASSPAVSAEQQKVINPSLDRPNNPNINETIHGGRMATQRSVDEQQKWYQPITGSAHLGQKATGVAEEYRVPVKYDEADMTPSQWPIEASTDLVYPYDAVRGRPTPMEYISRVPPIEVDGTLAVCDGGDGHPIEFLQLNKVKLDEPETCKYCGLRYIQAHDRRVHDSPHDAAERVDPTNLS